jgi:CheY-like chemotaxis protein
MGSEFDIGGESDRPALVRSSVLIVEDDPDTLQALCEVLDDAGYAVTGFSTGREAIQFLEVHRGSEPQVIIVDIVLPDMSGLDVAGVLKREPRLARIPVIVASGTDLPPEAVPTHLVAAVLMKPFDIEDVLDLVARLRSDGAEPW